MKQTIKAVSSENEVLTSTLHVVRTGLISDLKSFYETDKGRFNVTLLPDTYTLNFVTMLGERYDIFFHVSMLNNKHLGNSLACYKI